MLAALLQRLGVRPSERRLVTRLFWLHFLLISSYTLARAARSAVFLEEVGSRRLPYVYVAVALFTALVSWVLGRVALRQQLQRSLAQSLGCCALSLFGFGLLLDRVGGQVPPIAFYLWTGAYGLLLVSLFWMLANEAMDPREAKRLFGLVGAGGILGGLVGGGFSATAGPLVGPERLLHVAGAVLLGAVPLVRRVFDPGSSRVVQLPLEEEPQRPILRDSYVQLVVLLFLLGGVTASLVDYQFNVVVERQSGGDKLLLTRFWGWYHTLLNAGAILLQVLATGSLLRRFGAGSVGALLPGGVALGSALALLVKPAGPLLVAATRIYDAGLRVSLARTAWEFLYFPLPVGVRRRVKTAVDAVVDRASEAVGGLLLLVLQAGFGPGLRAAGIAALVFAAAWFLVNARLRGAYVRQLSSSLRRLVVDERVAEGPPEARLIEEAHHLLSSPFEKRALYAFELLESIDPEGLDRRLGDLLDHPTPAVRARTLARLGDPEHPRASPLLATLVHDESAEVRTEAVRIYAARYGDTEAQMERLLRSTDPAARTAAIVFLLSQPGPEAPAAERLDALLREGSASDRRAVAQALARRPRPSGLHARLRDLLDDPDASVRREAIVACGAVQRREFVPPLVELLAAVATRVAARSALAAFGGRVVGTIGDYLADETVALAVRRELPLVLAAIGTQEAANELLRIPHPADPVLLLRLLKAQNKIRARNPEVAFPRVAVQEGLQREVELFLRLHLHLEVWRRLEPRSRARDLVLASLEERQDATFSRIFRRLGLLYPAQEMFLGYRAFAGESRRTRAQALEYLDSVLLPEDRRVLVPVLENPERRTLLAEVLYGLAPYDRRTSLAALLGGTDTWLQACALYYVGTARLVELGQHARDTLAAASVPIVRETAAWSLRRLEAS